MARTVKCAVLGIEAEALDYAPYPGELGQRIYQSVSNYMEIGRASCRERV